MATALVLLADGFEEMEGIIVIDVLRRAEVQVTVASLHSGEIVASRKTKHLADVVIDQVIDQNFDAVILPGGAIGAQNLGADDRVRKILDKHKNAGAITAAICAAPNVFLKHGILKASQPFTMHPGAAPDPHPEGYRPSERVVRDGKVITSKGPGTAFEFALDIVEDLCGSAVKERVAEPMFVN